VHPGQEHRPVRGHVYARRQRCYLRAWQQRWREGLKGSRRVGEGQLQQQGLTSNGATAEAVDGIITAAQLSGSLANVWFTGQHRLNALTSRKAAKPSPESCSRCALGLPPPAARAGKFRCCQRAQQPPGA